MQTDTIHRWEAWPVGALVAAAGLNTALWYVGPAMPGEVRWLLPWLITVAAVASVIAIDGALIATIAGMREGRRSKWSAANITICAVFTGLAALAAHTLPDIGPWLHGLFALTIVSYAMHLAQPRQDALATLAARDKDLTEREQALVRRGQDQLEQGLMLRDREQALTEREQQPAKIEQVEYIRVASAELTWAEFTTVVNKAIDRQARSVSSLRRLVARED